MTALVSQRNEIPANAAQPLVEQPPIQAARTCQQIFMEWHNDDRNTTINNHEQTLTERMAQAFALQSGRSGCQKVLVVGPGKVEPLNQLANDEQVKKVTLVDFNPTSLDTCMAAVDPAKRGKFLSVVEDLTGGLYQKIDQIFQQENRPADQVLEEISQMLRDVAADRIPHVSAVHEKASLVYCSLVISQLPNILMFIINQKFADRYGAPVAKENQLGITEQQYDSYWDACKHGFYKINMRHLDYILERVEENGLVFLADTMKVEKSAQQIPMDGGLICSIMVGFLPIAAFHPAIHRAEVVSLGQTMGLLPPAIEQEIASRFTVLEKNEWRWHFAMPNYFLTPIPPHFIGRFVKDHEVRQWLLTPLQKEKIKREPETCHCLIS